MTRVFFCFVRWNYMIYLRIFQSKFVWTRKSTLFCSSWVLVICLPKKKEFSNNDYWLDNQNIVQIRKISANWNIVTIMPIKWIIIIIVLSLDTLFWFWLQTNDDFCWSCQEDEPELDCSTCVRSFHISASCSQAKKMPEEDLDWRCPACIEVDKDIGQLK